MMGERRSGQGALFYEFSLEAHVPADHLLRRIDQLIDFSEVARNWRLITARRAGPRSAPS